MLRIRRLPERGDLRPVSGHDETGRRRIERILGACGALEQVPRLTGEAFEQERGPVSARGYISTTRGHPSGVNGQMLNPFSASVSR